MSTELAPVFEFSTELASTTDDVIEAWLAGRRATTRRGYLSDLGQFAIWAKAPSPHAAVDSLLRLGPGMANRVVLKYIAYMKEVVLPDGTKGLASATINRRLAAIKGVVKFGRTIGVITWALDVQQETVEKRRDMSGPDLADTRLLFRAADGMGDRRPARRDRAIVAMLFDLGLRRAELCGLDLADVETDLNGRPLAVWIIGKGHREKQRLTVPEATGQVLAAWIEVRGIEQGPLFQRCDGRQVDADVRLTGESIRGITARLSAAAGLQRVRPHGLRHSAATTLLNEGRHLQDVQKFGRWSSVEMVVKYEDQRHDTAGELAGLLSRRLRDKGKPRR